MPQFDVSFYSSQLFWLIVCLLTLVYCFKRIFVPRMDTTLSKRDEHIEKHVRIAVSLENDIAIADNKVEKLQNMHKEEREEIIRNAMRNSERVMENQMRAIREENEALLNSVRYRLYGEMQKLESTFKIHVNDIARGIFDKIFFNEEEKHDERHSR
jgi:F0F1-type ATP synthase membrane subunit b/b'